MIYEFIVHKLDWFGKISFVIIGVYIWFNKSPNFPLSWGTVVFSRTLVLTNLFVCN